MWRRRSTNFSNIKPSIETIARSHHQYSFYYKTLKAITTHTCHLKFYPDFAKIHHYFLEPRPTLRGFNSQVWPATVIPFSINPWLTKYSQQKLRIWIRDLLLAAPLKPHFSSHNTISDHLAHWTPTRRPRQPEPIFQSYNKQDTPDQEDSCLPKVRDALSLLASKWVLIFRI